MLCGVIAAAVCLSSAGLGLTAINKTTAKAQDAGYKTVYDFTAVTDVASVTDFSVGIDNVDDMTVKMALTVIGCLPVLIVYPFFQKYFAKGVYLGSVKG